MTTQNIQVRAKIVWFAILASHGMLFFVANQVPNTQPAQPLDPMILKVFPFFAIGIWMIAWFLENIVGAMKVTVPRFPILLISWALFHAVSLFGFIIAMTSRNPNSMLPYVAAGIVGHFLKFPTEQRLVP